MTPIESKYTALPDYSLETPEETNEWVLPFVGNQGNTVLISKIFRESALLTSFQNFLGRSLPNQKNIFTYIPDPSKRISIVFEYGIRDENGFEFPDLVQICFGNAKVDDEPECLDCCEETLTIGSVDSVTLPPVPPAITPEMHLEIKRAISFTDLEESTQNAMLSLTADWPTNDHYAIEAKPRTLLHFLQRCLENESPIEPPCYTENQVKISTYTGSYPLSDKSRHGDWIQKNSAVRTGFVYKRVVMTGASGPMHVISEDYLTAIHQSLDGWIESAKQQLLRPKV